MPHTRIPPCRCRRALGLSHQPQQHSFIILAQNLIKGQTNPRKFLTKQDLESSIAHPVPEINWDPVTDWRLSLHFI
ncbi:hypothetical protein BJX76DRAFT_318829 [Aspergillus varians]